MAGAKVRITAGFSLSVKQDELARVLAQVTAEAKHLPKAADRAARRVFEWLRNQVARELGRQLGIPQAALKTRLTVRRYEGNPPAWVLFLGSEPMPVDKMGKVSQNRVGVAARGGTTKGGFISNVYADGRKAWIRKRRARALGLDLYGIDKGETFNNGRFPVMRISRDIHKAAAPIFKQYSQQAERRFYERLGHELAQLSGKR